MTCHRAQRLISVAQDGDLSARDHIRLERHLVECRSCSVLAHDLARMVGELRATPSAAASEAFAIELDRRLSARVPSRGLSAALLPTLGRWYRPLAVAAGCALLGVLTWSVHLRASRADELRRREVARSLSTTGVQSMALAASNPLDDITVANLAANAGAERSGEDLL